MFRNVLRTVVVMLALAPASVSHALADPFYATYETDSGQITAFLLEGTLQAGGDVVVVDDLLMTPTVNGVASPVVGASVQSWSDFLFNDGTAPTLSFSGSTMNFRWGDTPFTDGFLFDDATLTAFGGPVYAGGASFGDTLEPFDAGRWALTPVHTFDVTYETAAGDLLAFSFYGTMGPGSDTVGVIALPSTPLFNGVAVPLAGATAQSWSAFLFSDGTTPTLSFSGSTMNFRWGNTPFTDGFLFDDATLTAFGGPVYAGGDSFGDTIESFAADRWSLTRRVDAVPEPGTLGLSLAALLALAWRRGRTLRG